MYYPSDLQFDCLTMLRIKSMGINISWTMAKISLIRVEGQTGQSDQNQFLAECLRNSVFE